MAVVKITNREELDKLIAKLTLRMGRKPTQQEVLDICIKFGEANFESILAELTPIPVLDKKKKAKILTIAEELKDVPWETSSNTEWNNDDKAIYTL